MARIQTSNVTQLLSALGERPIALVGMMGAGKTSVGRRLAVKLGRKFIDSDHEITEAAAMSISDYFEAHGEAAFRAGETRVIARILEESDIVLGTGGGAFMTEETRDLIKSKAISVWIKADFELLFARVSRRPTRPLLQTPDPRQTLKDLMAARYPTYAKADITIMSRDVPHDAVVDEIIDQMHKYLCPPEENLKADNAPNHPSAPSHPSTEDR